MKQRIRLTESDLHRIIKESVNEVLNELGDSDRIHNYLGTISGYYEAQGNRDKANRAFNLSNRLQKNRNNGQLYDPNSEKSASEYRKNSYAYTNGFDKGWDKGRHQMEEATAGPRWRQKDGEFPDMKDDAYSRSKRQVKVSEEQLHNIIKESVNRILKEGYVSNEGNGMVGGYYGSSYGNCHTYFPWESIPEVLSKDGLIPKDSEDELYDYLSQYEDEFRLNGEWEYSWDESTNYSGSEVYPEENGLKIVIDFVRTFNHPLLTDECKKAIIKYFTDWYNTFPDSEWINDDD